MRRRAVLLSLGSALAGLAGCAGQDVATDGGKTPSSGEYQVLELGESYEDGSRTVSVTSVDVREAILKNLGFITIKQSPGHQFLCVGIEGTDIPLDSEWFVFTADETDRVSPINSVADIRSPHEVVGYELPSEAVTGGRVLYRKGQTVAAWTIDDEATADLQHVPEFAVEDVRLVPADRRGAIQLTVANDGARDGVFRGLARTEGRHGGGMIRVPVPRDRTVTTTVRPNRIEVPGPADATIQPRKRSNRVFVISHD